MRTREERQADRQARRQERRANRGEAINDLFNTVTGQTPPPPPPPPPPVPETPVVDPRQQELYRQAREVSSGNVNPAQAEYFRQQNEGLFDIKERKGAKNTLNPVSNRSDGMTDVYADLYGSEESRGF